MLWQHEEYKFMKTKLLFTFFFIFIGISNHAKPKLDPTATMTLINSTVCKGTSTNITITGTPNSTVTISSYSSIPYRVALSIGPTGTGIFTTPPLYETTSYTLENIRLMGSTINTYIGQTVTITVISGGCPTLSTSPTNSTTCNSGECRTLTATVPVINSTTSYSVTAIPFCPEADYPSQTVNEVSINQNDDTWSPVISLPFNFSFFNQNYNSCQIGTNGVLTFNPQTAGSTCDYEMNGLNIPNAQFVHKNSIFGVFQDTDTRISNQASPSDVSVNWTIQGTYPCRKLIVNFYQLGLFQCNQSLGTQNYQIVLHEVSNIIDVYIQNRSQCTAWENGAGVVGVINTDGTLGYTPPLRNTNDTWTAANEAWRFTPNGANIPVNVQWFESGNPLSIGPSVTVCPTASTTYTVEASFQVNGIPYVLSAPSNTINVVQDITQSPMDLNVCYDPTEVYTIDLTSNDAVILGTAHPDDYEIQYFTSLENAQNFAQPITNPANFTFSQDQTVYAGIQYNSYGCIIAKPFSLTISAPVNAPSGISPQTLYQGQTLADVVVTGDTIQWYDAPDGGNLLPISTVLQNNFTYYATQSVNSCESRMTQSFRLVIVVNLGTDDFGKNSFNFYPNPTSDILNLTSSLSDVKLYIFNTLSQKMETRILNAGSNTIDLSNFTAGIYLFQLSLEGKSKTYKVVKN